MWNQVLHAPKIETFTVAVIATKGYVIVVNFLKLISVHMKFPPSKTHHGWAQGEKYFKIGFLDG